MSPILFPGLIEVDLSKEDMFQTFDKARAAKAPFVFVTIHAVDSEKVIVVPAKSFDAKEQFYDKAYNDNLVHVMNSNVFFRGVSYREAEQLNNII